jgi:hypothetical protein
VPGIVAPPDAGVQGAGCKIVLEDASQTPHYSCCTIGAAKARVRGVWGWAMPVLVVEREE